MSAVSIGIRIVADAAAVAHGHFLGPQALLGGLKLHFHRPAIRGIPHSQIAQRLGPDSPERPQVGEMHPVKPAQQGSGQPVAKNLLGHH